MPNITQPTTHLAKVKWEAPTCGSPNFVGSVVAMLRADWPSFVIHRLGAGTWPQPFLRKTVENQKRSFKLDTAISLHRAHARCERCHSASRAIRAICGRPAPVVAPCAAWGDRFAAVSRDDCGRPKLEFSQRLSFRKAPPGDPIGKPALQAHGQDVGDGERCQFYPQEMPRRHLTKLHYSVDFQRKQQEQKPNNKHLH